MDTIDAKAAAVEARKHRVIPQGYDETDELIAIYTLLTLNRAAEAKQRLEILLDRWHGTWRCGRS